MSPTREEPGTTKGVGKSKRATVPVSHIFWARKTIKGVLKQSLPCLPCPACSFNLAKRKVVKGIVG